jgi:hypothetical protein
VVRMKERRSMNAPVLVCVKPEGGAILGTRQPDRGPGDSHWRNHACAAFFQVKLRAV